MIDVAPGQCYLLDVFRVEGGKQHDYIFHARGTDVTFDNLRFGPEQTGSLAGKEIDWASKLGSDGDVQGVPNKPYWNPPPGNGFGFLPRPRAAAWPEKPWSVTWNVDSTPPAARLKLTMLPADGQVVTSTGPGNYPHWPKAQYVLARRSAGQDLTSTFTSIIEPFGDAPAVKTVTPLKSSDDAVAVRVDLADGRIDYLIHREPASKTTAWADGDRSIAFDGSFALVRWKDGKAVQATAVGGTSLKMGDLEVRPEPQVQSPIERIDYDRNILYTKAALPTGSTLAGQFLSIGNPRYAQTSSYRIESVSRDGDLSAIHLAPTRLILGRGHLDAAPPPDGKTLPNVTPLEYGKSLKHAWSGFFRGKYVATPDGRASTHLQRLDDHGMTMTVDDSTGFAAGDDVLIYDVRPGDTLTLTRSAQFPRLADHP
jgi:hypothetical protein